MVIQAASQSQHGYRLARNRPASFTNVQYVSYRHLQKDPYLDNPHVSFHPSPTSYAS